MSLSCRIANLEINPAIMNASGIFSFPSVLKRNSKYLGAVVTKSIGYEERMGNETPVFVQVLDEAYLNAIGLSNPGYKAMRKELEEYYPYFQSVSKPIIASIFGGSEKEFVEIAKALEDVCDAFELNYSCPNLIGDEKIGIVIGRDPELVKRYTCAVRENITKPIIVKLSPGPYIDDRKKVIDIAKAAENEGADAISAINTIPGGMKIDIYARRPVLTAGYCGVSGKEIKSIGIGCVRTIYESVDIPIIGIGGIETAEDIVEYVEAGATAVGIGTAFIDKSTEKIEKYLSNLIQDLKNLLKELNVNSLSNLKGVGHV